MLAPIGGEGQERILRGTVLLHGDAALAACYLAAAGIGRLLVTGEAPTLAARDPSFRMERVPVGAAADVVLDLGDGLAWHAAKGPRVWGGALGGSVLLGVEPRQGPPPEPAARAILETLGAAEALRLLLGLGAHRHAFV